MSTDDALTTAEETTSTDDALPPAEETTSTDDALPPAEEAMSTTEQSPVLAEHRGPVLLITFNRPARLNAWNDAVEQRYFDLLTEAEADPEVRAVVITGAGRGFCAGADLQDLKTVGDRTPEDLARPRRPRDLPMGVRKPLIGAVNGAAAGLGLVEALYCDVRFAGHSAKFTTAFAHRGLIAEYGIAWLLSRIVGQSRATDLLLSARLVDSAEAFRIGLVDFLLPDEQLLGAALAYATELATSSSPRSMAIIKSQLRSDGDGDYPSAVERSVRLMHESFTAPDVREGVASHLEKRPPQFPPLSSQES